MPKPMLIPLSCTLFTRLEEAKNSNNPSNDDIQILEDLTQSLPFNGLNIPAEWARTCAHMELDFPGCLSELSDKQNEDIYKDNNIEPSKAAVILDILKKIDTSENKSSLKMLSTFDSVNTLKSLRDMPRSDFNIALNSFRRFLPYLFDQPSKEDRKKRGKESVVDAIEYIKKRVDEDFQKALADCCADERNEAFVDSIFESSKEVFPNDEEDIRNTLSENIRELPIHMKSRKSNLNNRTDSKRKGEVCDELNPEDKINEVKEEIDERGDKNNWFVKSIFGRALKLLVNIILVIPRLLIQGIVLIKNYFTGENTPDFKFSVFDEQLNENDSSSRRNSIENNDLESNDFDGIYNE